MTYGWLRWLHSGNASVARFPGFRILRPKIGAAAACGGLILALVCGSPGNASANSLVDSWSAVQQSWAAGDAAGLEADLQRLTDECQELGLRRVTPFAAALAAGSVNQPEDIRNLLLQSAKRLDPILPEVRFCAGKAAWADGRRMDAVGEVVSGTINLLRDAPSRRATLASTIPWVILTLGLTVGVYVVVNAVRYVRQVGYDAFLIGSRFLSKANAVVFACVALTLPLIVGLGPVWAFAYVFALGVVYMPHSERVAAFVVLVLMGLLIPSLEAWQSRCLKAESLQVRISRMLVERQADFVSLQELTELEPELSRSPTFHLVSGELLRMHGDRDNARLEYEKTLLEAPKSSLPRIFLGVLSLEDRDTFRALELLDDAVKLSPESPLAHYNLAIALDLTRRFEEGDAARRRARELSGGDFRSIGLRGREDRVLFPKLGHRMVEQLLDDVPDALLPVLGQAEPWPIPIRNLFAPLTMVSVAAVVVAVMALLLAMLRGFSPAKECTKCGKVFRAEDNTVYCEQCVSVFLRRNAVSIEQQTAKQRQVRRWDFLVALCRRIVGILVPGGSALVSEQPFWGFFLTLLVWLPLVGALFWVPFFLVEAVPSAPNIILQYFLATVGLFAWAVTAVTAWSRR